MRNEENAYTGNSKNRVAKIEAETKPMSEHDIVRARELYEQIGACYTEEGQQCSVCIIDIVQALRDAAAAEREAWRPLVLICDRLCTAIEQAEQDIGHESIDKIIKELGPATDKGLKAIRERDDEKG